MRLPFCLNRASACVGRGSVGLFWLFVCEEKEDKRFIRTLVEGMRGLYRSFLRVQIILKAFQTSDEKKERRDHVTIPNAARVKIFPGCECSLCVALSVSRQKLITHAPSSLKLPTTPVILVRLMCFLTRLSKNERWPENGTRL